MDLKDLYREVILDHNRHPRNFGVLDPADAQADGHNRLCGDQLHITLRRDGNRLTAVQFDGHGCAISVASASLMTEAVTGLPLQQVGRISANVLALLTGELATLPDDARVELGKLNALSGVVEFPARVKCASLCWHTLEVALGQSTPPVAGQPISTE